MALYTTWAMMGAVLAVALGNWLDLFQLGTPQAWIAALTGGALGYLAYRGTVEPSILAPRKPERTSRTPTTAP